MPPAVRRPRLSRNYPCRRGSGCCVSKQLNEPSWALLFLDPACERQLELPATLPSALLDAPYASLRKWNPRPATACTSRSSSNW